jgi:hypothetical protein
MAVHNITKDLYKEIASGRNTLSTVTASTTLNLQGRQSASVNVTSSCTVTLPSVPSAGVEVYIRSSNTSTVTIADAGGTIGTFTGTSGTTMARCVSTDSNSWAVETVGVSTENTLAGTSLGTGFIDIPLVNWRLITSNDITNAAGNGGVLGTDTTPALEYVNGDTQSNFRLLWAAGGQQVIAMQAMLPPDLDDAQPIVFHASALMGGSDSPVLSLDSYFYGVSGDGGAKVEDDTTAVVDATSEITATIAASDVTAGTLAIEITPGAHASHTLAVFSTWLTYTRAF